MKWQFTIDYKRADGKVGAPCDGYIVQRVDVQCSFSQCGPGAKPMRDNYAYYEACEVDPRSWTGGGGPQERAGPDSRAIECGGGCVLSYAR